MSDDELIERMAEAILTASLPYRGPGGQTVPYVMPVHVDMARAALAVARPAIRDETLDEVTQLIGKKQPHWGVTTDYDRGFLDGWDDHQIAIMREVRSLRSDSKGDSK